MLLIAIVTVSENFHTHILLNRLLLLALDEWGGGGGGGLNHNQSLKCVMRCLINFTSKVISSLPEFSLGMFLLPLFSILSFD